MQVIADGAFVRRVAREEGAPAGEIGRVLHALDESPERAGDLSLAVDFEHTGVAIHLPQELDPVEPPARFRGKPV